MRIVSGWLVGLFIGAVLMTACSGTSAETPAEEPAAVVQQIDGSELSRVILSEQAAQRLDIKTSPVREAELSRKGTTAAQLRKIIPYSAILYDVDGKAFVYTSIETRTFVRAPVTIDYIQGDEVIASDGPPAGTAVVTVGAVELFGTEFVFEEN
jgi:hypothetical protein